MFALVISMPLGQPAHSETSPQPGFAISPGPVLRENKKIFLQFCVL